MSSLAHAIRRDERSHRPFAGGSVVLFFRDLISVVEDARSMQLPNNACVDLSDQDGIHPLVLSVASSKRGFQRQHEMSAGLAPLQSARSAARVRTLSGLRHALTEFINLGIAPDAPCRWVDAEGLASRPAFISFAAGQWSRIAFECA